MKQQKHRLPVDHYILHMNHDQTIDVDLRHIAHVIDSCWRDAPCLQILNEFTCPLSCCCHLALSQHASTVLSVAWIRSSAEDHAWAWSLDMPSHVES